MIHLVYGLDEQVAEWAASKIGLTNYKPCSAIGVANGLDIIAGCIYNNFHTDIRGRPLCIEITMVSIDKHWCSKAIIRELLAYPFSQLKVERVQLSAPKRNKFVRKFNERLGFKFEGIARKAYFTGEDMAVYSMLRREWMNSPYGQKVPLASSGSRSSGYISSTNTEQSANCSL